MSGWISEVKDFMKRCHFKAMMLPLLSLAMGLGQAATAYADEETTATTTKTVYQDTDPTPTDGSVYLARRHALVGKNCVVNRISPALVTAASGTTNLESLVDEDLTNSVSFISTAEVSLGVRLFPSVRDMAHVYRKGTTAGFVVTAGSNTLLKLAAVETPYQLYFYKDGEKVGSATPTQFGSAGVLNLTLISWQSSDATLEYSAPAPADFDEVRLVQTGGLDLEVLKTTIVKYAFVGDKRYNITAEKTGGFADYCKAMGETDVPKIYGEDIINVDKEDLIDDDPSNSVACVKALVSGVTGVQVACAKEGIFKKGSVIGFDVLKTDVLDVAGTVIIKLWKFVPYEKSAWNGKEGEWTKVEEKTLSMDVLKLKLGTERTSFAITAAEDFNAVSINFTGLLGVSVMNVYNAFVSPAPTIDDDIDLQVSADQAICDEQQSFTLRSNEQVKWTRDMSSNNYMSEIKLSPEGTLCEQATVSGFKHAGSYRFIATDADGNTASTTIQYGITPVIDLAEKPWVNNQTMGESYEIADKTGFGGISITGNVSNASCLLSASLDDYASYTGGLKIAEVKNAIVGVKRTDKKVKNDYDTRIGFVAGVSADVLSLDLLNSMTVKAYNDGVEVASQSVAQGGEVLGLKLAGSDQTRTLSYSLVVPAGTEFNTIALVSSGLIQLDLNQMKIYYAYEEPEEEAQRYEKLRNRETLISRETTGAYINNKGTIPTGTGVASVGSAWVNVANLIDGSDETYMQMDQTVGVATGQTIAVKLGRRFSKGNVIGVYLNNVQNLLKVDLANVMTITPYLEDMKHTETTSPSWSVLGLDLLGGSASKTLITVQPKNDFDEIRITLGNGVQALGYTHISAIVVRGDADGDGIVDAVDDQSCTSAFDQNEQLTGNGNVEKSHDYTHSTLYLERDLKKGIWSTLTLPVDISYNQFVSTFGSDAELAEPADFNEAHPNQVFMKVEPTYGNNTFIHRGRPYLVKVVTEGSHEEDSYSDGGKPVSIASTQNYYTIQGVDFRNDWFEGKTAPDAREFKAITSDCLFGDKITWHGTFRQDEIPHGGYAYNTSGRLWEYFISEKGLQNGVTGTKIKALRAYMTDGIDYTQQTQAAAKMFSVNINGTVEEGGQTLGISDVNAKAETKAADVYTLQGVKVRQQATSLEGLQPGVYVWKNRKVVVR